MPWFKFLATGAVGPFSGYQWPAPRDGDDPGGWAHASGPLDPCRAGLHVCRLADLPYWLHEELYLVDVDGPVVDHDSFVLARRARLLKRVTMWGRESAYGFSCDCAWRVRDLTAEALSRAVRQADADRLLGCRTMDELGRTARRIEDSDGTEGVPLAGYAADAATFAAAAESGSGWASAAATTAFVAATAARVAAEPDDGRAALKSERLHQAHRIAELAGVRA